MATRSIQIEGPYTTAERDALASPDLHQIIYNSDTEQFEFWDGAGWQGVLGDNVVFDSIVVGNLDAGVVVINHLRIVQTFDKASANDLNLSNINGNLVRITGTTQINRILSASTPQPLYLFFEGSLTIKHNQAAGGGFIPILLAGGVDYVTSADDILQFALTPITGTFAWREVSRTLAATTQTYTPSNVTTDRSYDANATTIDELADVLGTLIADLRAKRIVI